MGLRFLRRRQNGGYAYKNAPLVARRIQRQNRYFARTWLQNRTLIYERKRVQKIPRLANVQNLALFRRYDGNNNANILYLNQSYRTTKQISLEANKILDFLNLGNAIPVLRVGEEVKYDVTDNIHLYIENMKNKGYSSIAVLCKDEFEVEDKYLYLRQFFPEIKKINSQDNVYEGGLCIIDVMSSKGLEFDSVIISDVSESKYSSEIIIDYKKLYVAMTRSLHELVLCYDSEPTLALKKEQNKILKK